SNVISNQYKISNYLENKFMILITKYYTKIIKIKKQIKKKIKIKKKNYIGLKINILLPGGAKNKKNNNI
ncbi:hypothetical protein, partial [Staphylococcus aureus]|uniref:hypothetical protein n=1 Tax=Staphylococcus aureus TaxID=1280 RepID=UPI0021B10EE5